MIDKWLRLIDGATIFDVNQLLNDLLFNLFIVSYKLLLHIVLNFESEVHDLFDLVNQILVATFLQSELDWDVTSVYTGAKTLDMTANIGLGVDKVAIVKPLKLLNLLVGEDDITTKGLSHEQVLAKGSGTFTQDLIWVGGDDSAERKDEIMDHLLVKEISSHSIRARVLCQLLWTFFGIGEHQLRV